MVQYIWGVMAICSITWILYLTLKYRKCIPNIVALAINLQSLLLLVIVIGNIYSR
jgi:hypothetical protein